MKPFFFQMIVFLVVLVIFDKGFGYLLSRSYFAQNHEAAYKTTYTFDKADQQVLIIGSSRAEFHYMPKYLKTA